MPWHLHHVGNSRLEKTTGYTGLVHVLYADTKDDRIYWITRCGWAFSDRDNTNHKLQPRLSRKPVTCLECIATQLRFGAPW